MRHFRSILYALVLAPAVWVLAAVGLTSDLTTRGSNDFAVESFTGLLLLLLAGGAYGILAFAPISPAGPTLAGMAYLFMALWALATPSAYADAWPPGVAKEGFDLTRPGYGLAVLLAVPLICTALSARRWERYVPPVLPIIGALGRARGAVPISSLQTAPLPTAGTLDPDPTTVLRLPVGGSEDTTVVRSGAVEETTALRDAGDGVSAVPAAATVAPGLTDDPTQSLGAPAEDEATADVAASEEATSDVAGPSEEATSDVATPTEEATAEVPAASEEATSDVAQSEENTTVLPPVTSDVVLSSDANDEATTALLTKSPDDEATTALPSTSPDEAATAASPATSEDGETGSALAATSPDDEVTTALPSVAEEDEPTAAVVSDDDETNAADEKTDAADGDDEETDAVIDDEETAGVDGGDDEPPAAADAEFTAAAPTAEKTSDGPSEEPTEPDPSPAAENQVAEDATEASDDVVLTVVGTASVGPDVPRADLETTRSMDAPDPDRTRFIPLPLPKPAPEPDPIPESVEATRSLTLPDPDRTKPIPLPRPTLATPPPAPGETTRPINAPDPDTTKPIPLPRAKPAAETIGPGETTRPVNGPDPDRTRPITLLTGGRSAGPPQPPPAIRLRAPAPDDADEKTQILRFPTPAPVNSLRGPGEQTRVIPFPGTGDVGGDETQVIRLPVRHTDDERTQVIRPSLVEAPGDRTQVLKFPTPGNNTPGSSTAGNLMPGTSTPPRPKGDKPGRPVSIVGSENPNFSEDPTGRLVPPDPRPEDDERSMTVMNMERPPDEPDSPSESDS